ncbi:MAG: hypothetical protein FWH38_06175, partial [Treponema sp.]|nr:hypothetical protein [Treponema sp.]
MTAHFSKKTSWLRCLISFLSAIGVAALLCALLDGPRLGPFYDFLLLLRPAPPVSGELLIIDSSVSGNGLGDDILEPGAAASLLYTMAELGAGTLIIQVPILGLSAGGNTGEEEIVSRFDEEFSILSRNIRNLFDAIRMGSVAPNESARYVGELVELSEKGKERLVSALVRRDEAGVISMENAAVFFGHARRPSDLRVQLIRSGEAGRPGVLAERDEYSKAQSDRDGVVRRITPVIAVPEVSEAGSLERTVEHIIYAALKTRFETSGIQSNEYGPVLVARNGPDGTDRIIPLDRSGALLFEVPHRWGGFRRIGISDFLAYDEADRSLRRILLDAEALGLFDSVNGEDNPGILYDYALSLREEPESSFRSLEEKKLLWIEGRNRYFTKLEDFLNGPAEMNLVRGYEEMIAEETMAAEPLDQNPLGGASLAKMIELRDSLIGAFAAIRAKHGEVLELRTKLETALSSSFCILGNTQDVEISALLANSILTGRAIKPGANRHLFLGAVISALVICFLVKSLGPISTLGAGAILSLLFGIGFSMGFIFSGLWLDPFVPAAASGMGVLVSAAWALIAVRRHARQFRQAFGPFVSGPCLKSLIRAGRPLPSHVLTVRAAIVAIKNA